MELTHVFFYIYDILKARVYRVVSVKIVEEPVPWASPSTKQPINCKMLSESTLSEIWQLVKGLQQPSEHINPGKRLLNTNRRTCSIFTFSDPMPPPPLPSSAVVVRMATGFPVQVPGAARNSRPSFQISVAICFDLPGGSLKVRYKRLVFLSLIQISSWVKR